MITKREVLFSVIIVAIMLSIGVFVHFSISQAINDGASEYNTALHIDNDKELFRYALRTSVGDTLAYGSLKVADPVSMDHLKGKYAAVRRVAEKYTMHTRMVKTGKTWRTQVYFTWDYAGEDNVSCETLKFLGASIPYTNIDLPSEDHIDTVYETSTFRYQYYGKPTEYTGCLYANLTDKQINNPVFHNERTLQEVLNDKKSAWPLVLFWVLYGVFIAAAVALFFFIDNKWLEK